MTTFFSAFIFLFFGFSGFGFHFIGLLASYCVFRRAKKVYVGVCQCLGTKSGGHLITSFYYYFSTFFNFAFLGFIRFRTVLYRLSGFMLFL